MEKSRVASLENEEPVIVNVDTWSLSLRTESFLKGPKSKTLITLDIMSFLQEHIF